MKNIVYDEVMAYLNAAIEIVNQVAEEYRNDIVSQLAEVYAANFKKHGVDVTEKLETAVQNAFAMNEAYLRGRQDERDKFNKWREEYNNSEIPNMSEKLTSSEGFCEWKPDDREFGVYYTKCGNVELFSDGSPSDNKYKFCPYCGKEIKVVE